ncbi:MAG TPA: preprotein translocase subunit SecE [Candidatus Dorea intestinavium]|nr:preprotein translocase subunit SecE [Candidatus Dorea intestinavium]
MSKEKTQKKNKFKELKNEFKKIIWPDKMTLAKQTGAVVVISVILGGIIALVDFILKYGVDLWINLG